MIRALLILIDLVRSKFGTHRLPGRQCVVSNMIFNYHETIESVDVVLKPLLQSRVGD